jgi:FKBP-type peptidyl-prolyl cis-trans isomerase SlyD
VTRRPRTKRPQASDGYQAGPGTVVALRYSLFDAEGELVEESAAGAPLVLLLGYGDAAPALEHAVGGLSAGDEREVVLDAKDAFGARDPEAIIEVDRADFPADLAPGDELAADRDDGTGVVTLKVLEILDDVVVLDTNHPLSGQRVKLRLFVESVRPASPEELSEAAERLARDPEPSPQPLLPAERLLRRGSSNCPQGDDPPPLRHPGGGGNGLPD